MPKHGSKKHSKGEEEPMIDNLKEDPPLNGQRYAVVSFVNPTDMVLTKNLYYVNHFLCQDVNKMIVAQASHMAKKVNVMVNNCISAKLDKLKMSVDEEDKHMYRILNDHLKDLVIDEDEFVDECHRKYTIDEEEISDKYKIYIAENRTRLDKEFDDAYDDVCSVRGFKVRGTYDRYQDAADRCKYVRDAIEPGVHAYVVSVGTWFPVDMEADEIQDQDYMLPALNDLMGKYHEGMRARDAHYRERKRDMIDNSSSSGNDTKSRLQKKLLERKHQKIREDVEQFKQQNASDVNSEQTKKKKKRKHKKKTEEAAEAAETSETSPVAAATE